MRLISSNVDPLDIVEIEVATCRWRLSNGLSLEGGRLILCLRLGLSRLRASCWFRNGSLLILRQGLIHLDHLVIEAVSCCVKLGTTVVRIVIIQLSLTLLFTLL